MGDRHAHVGRAKLREDRAVDIFDEAVDHRLGVDDDVERVGADGEHVKGLDQLEPLVHQGRAIDRDLGAHRPVRMGHRFRRGRGAHALDRPGAERSAARGEDDPPNGLRMGAVEALEHRIMLGIDRQQGRAARPRGLGHQRAGGDQRLLVGEGDRSAAFEGAHHRRQACGADDRGHRPFGAGGRGVGDCPLACRRLDVRSGKCVPQRPQQPFVADHGLSGAEIACQLGKAGNVGVGGEGAHLVALAVAGDEIERRAADRPGRSQDGDGARAHPVQNPAISMTVVRRATASSPSSRSSTPPCPGSRPPESLIPARRFSQLS